MPEKPLGEKLQSIPRWVLYVVLIAVTSIPLFITISVPNKPTESTIDLFARLSEIEPGSTVLIASDWTNSTRGESGGHFESLIRILMRRDVKFAIYSTADPQAPQVAMDAMARLNAERQRTNQRVYERWNDYLILGYLPNAEAAGQAIANNFRAAFSSKREVAPDGAERDVFQSPVLQKYSKLSDFPLLVIVTASKTSTVSIERFAKTVPIALMVTGVMGPESYVYYASGQVVALAAGLKGVYDMETMMEVGVNLDSPGSVKAEKYAGKQFANFAGQPNTGNGARYYPTLHAALTLLILAVIIGNVGVALSRRRG
jgi:hypothetical protein